jgi:hypothetical protein
MNYHQFINPCKWAIPIRRKTAKLDSPAISRLDYAWYDPLNFEDVPIVHTENGMRFILRMKVSDVPAHLQSILGSYPSLDALHQLT